MPFAMSLMIRLPESHRLGGDTARAEFDYGGRTLAVHAVGAATIGDASSLMFIGRDFTAEQDALRFGEAFRGHLRLASIAAKFPVDVGGGEVVSRTGSVVKDVAARSGYQLLDVVHGLAVFEQTDDDRFFFASAGAFKSTLPTRLFNDALPAIERDLPPVADGTSLALACDLRSVYTFDPSPRAQFVTLVSALEALWAHGETLERQWQPCTPSRVVDIVNGWLEQLSDETTVGADELDSLRSRVGGLKRPSITASVTSLVREFAPGDDDDPNAEFVARCYELRSRLVHGSSDVPDVSGLRGRLAGIVDEMILAMAAT